MPNDETRSTTNRGTNDQATANRVKPHSGTASDSAPTNPDARVTTDSSRLTRKSNSFADLDNELDLLELNSLLKNGKPGTYEDIVKRLYRWAEYYQYPDHRGEIHDIMERIVLPFLQEELKDQLTNFRLTYYGKSPYEGGRDDYIRWGGDIRIIATVLKLSSGGAGSHAPQELYPSTETVKVITYSSVNARLVSGTTYLERQGTTTPVNFNVDDLINIPKLLFSLAKFSAKRLPRLGSRRGKLPVELGKRMGTDTVKHLSKPKLEKLKVGLSKLAKVSVELGTLTGNKFTKISGGEAIRRLFSGKLYDFPRLAQHWPKKLANEYVSEIQRLIIGRVKNPKLAKEVTNAFATNKVNSMLLKKFPEDLQRAVKSLVDTRWKTIRKAFWRNVFDDQALVAELKKIGLTFGNIGTAPVLEIGGTKLKITLDHIARKVENPLEAFSPNNLRILTSRDNSVLKEGLVKNIKELTGLTLDEYNTLGRASERLPKELADELGKVLDALPNEEDLFRGLGWPP